jgi:hypothetical protein
MAAPTLEELVQRIDRLEEELRRLKALVETNSGKRGWEAIVGAHEGSKVFEEIAREGRKIRRADRKATLAELDKQARRKTR